MPDDTQPDSPLAWDDLSPDQQHAIVDLAQARLEGGVDRRTLMQALGATGVGALLGGGSLAAVDRAAGQASTSDGDGDVGLPGDPVDVFADGVDANEIATGELNTTTHYIREEDYSGDLGNDINGVVSSASKGDTIVIVGRSGGNWYTSTTKAVIDKEGITLRGPGLDTPCMEIDANVIGIETQSSFTTVEGISIRTSSGVRSSHSTQGIHSGSARSRVRWCYVQFMGDNGIIHTDSFGSNVTEISSNIVLDSGQNVNTEVFEGNGIAIETTDNLPWTSDGGGPNVNACLLSFNDCRENANNGIMNGGNKNAMLQNHTSYNGAYGIKLSGADDSYVIGGFAEGNTNGPLHIDSNSDRVVAITGFSAGNVTDDNANNGLVINGGQIHPTTAGSPTNDDPTTDAPAGFFQIFDSNGDLRHVPFYQ